MSSHHTERDWAAELKAAGMRVTPGRLAVLDALATAPHATADEVQARLEGATLTRQGVYLTLNELVERGFSRRIVGSGAARYEIAAADNHHHLICEQCGRIVDIECHLGEAPCIHLPAALGVEVREAEVTFRGRCAECASAA